MRKLSIVGFCWVSILLTGCSPRDYLTRRLATDLIATSETFNSPQQFILHTGVMSNKTTHPPNTLSFSTKDGSPPTPSPARKMSLPHRAGTFC